MINNIITVDQLAPILNKFSLGELSSPIEQITDGWTNLTFKFETKPYGKMYILRQYLSTTERSIILEDIIFELNFISYLFTELHLPVVPMIDPPGILTLNNEIYVFFPFIDGIKYVNTPKNPLRQLWQTIEISRFLGRMHSIDKQKTFPSFNRRTFNIVDIKYKLLNSCSEFEKDYPDLYKRISKILNEGTQSIPLIEDEIEQKIFEKNFEKNLPMGVIHVDIHDENVLFCHNENKIAAVLDFDDMAFGPFLIDIAMTLCFWCSYGSTLNTNYVKEFLIEYQNERNMLLINDEWNLLEIYCYMTMFHQLLFTIQSRNDREVTEKMIEELLCPIEQIFQDKIFLKKIQ